MSLINRLLRNFEEGRRRHFIQPLAVALVFLLFALLFFSMAMVDLRRLEALLMDALTKKAQYVVDVIEKASREKYMHLMREGDEYRDLFRGAVVDDQAFALQESLVSALVDVARYVDLELQTGVSMEEKVRELASSENLLAIAVLDEHGGLAFQSSPTPPEVISHGRALVKGGENIAVHLFHGSRQQEAGGAIGIRKKAGNGAVIIALDRNGIEYWARKTCINAAIEELPLGTGVAYISVEDKKGLALARFSDLSPEKIEECLLFAGSAGDTGSPEGQCVRVGNTRFLQLSFPFQWDGTNIGKAHIGLESHETDRLLVENRGHIFVWTGLMVFIGFLGMGALYKTQNRHVSKMQDLRERLYRAERLSSLGKLGAEVAHEIRNPLNAISMAAQRIQRDFVPEDYEKKESFNRITFIIKDEIRRLNGIVEDFLSLSRSNRMDFRQQPIVDLLERIVFLVREEARTRGIRIEKQWATPGPLISLDAAKMEQAILNIVRNAMESITGEGVVSISCGVSSRKATSITIRDNGVGIPAGKEKEIFDPFYTTKEDGVGLGLSIAHEIIAAHGGHIEVTGKEGGGTTFEVLLPSV